MLCSLPLKPHTTPMHLRQPSGRFNALSERFFNGALTFYEITLRWVIRHRRLTLYASFGLLGLTGWLFVVTPKGFLPRGHRTGPGLHRGRAGHLLRGDTAAPRP
jgi:multidrug efflux pump subunit AcrB